MIIAKLNGKLVERVGRYRDFFPNVSFPSTGPSREFLAEHGYGEVLYDKPYNKLTEKLRQCPTYYEKGKVYAVEKVAMTSGEIAEQKAAAFAVLRNERNALLADCDGYMAEDSTADKKAWGAYRDALRKFPAMVADARMPYSFPKAPDQ